MAENCFMLRCYSAQISVLSAGREKCKQVVSSVRGDCEDVTCPFHHSGVVKVLKAGQLDTNDPVKVLKSDEVRTQVARENGYFY